MELTLSDFEKIKVYQPKEGYRFSFEPFILTKLSKKYSSAIDFGSGCGIIAIILSKLRKVEQIYAVENNPQYREIIKKNLELNNIENVFVFSNIEELQNNIADIIISNPPYFNHQGFRLSKKFLSEKFERLPIDSLVGIIKNKLKPYGILRLSYHPTRLIELFDALRNYNFGIKTIQHIYGKPNTNACASIVEANIGRKNYLIIKEPIFLNNYELFE